MGITILLVDDDQELRSYLRRLLDREQDLRVVGEAGDGAIAFELTQAMPPDIVLMDLNMPRLNGLDATRMIKAEQPKTKVIILTQYQEDPYRRAALECGADAFLPKQTRLPDLLATIREVTQGAQASRPHSQ
jgi:DNA-binding NarL/FixJ family response regulator